MISSEIERIKNAKEKIKQKLIDKGMKIADEKLDEYSTVIDKMNILNVPEYLPRYIENEYGGDVVLEGGLHNCITEISGLNDVKISNFEGLFSCWRALQKFPKTIDTSKATNLEKILYFCESITDISSLKTDSCENLNDAFNTCTNLEEIPLLNTSKVKSMKNTFRGCKNLHTIPLLDTGNVTDMSSTFNFCSNLNTIPLIDTSNVENMQYMFCYCENLTDVPKLNTNKVTSVYGMFMNCYELNSIPAFEFSNLESADMLFYNCSSLQEIPAGIKTPKLKNASQMFSGCTSLSSIKLLDFSSAKSISSMLSKCTNLISVEGFLNLGKGFKEPNSGYDYPHNYSKKLNLSDCPLSKESILNIFNNLYDLKIAYDVDNGGSLYTQDIILGTENYSKLTESEIQIATDKSWTVKEVE